MGPASLARCASLFGAGQVAKILAAGLREVGNHFFLPEPCCNVGLGHPLDQKYRAPSPAFAVYNVDSFKLKARGAKDSGLGRFGRASSGSWGLSYGRLVA